MSIFANQPPDDIPLSELMIKREFNPTDKLPEIPKQTEIEKIISELKFLLVSQAVYDYDLKTLISKLSKFINEIEDKENGKKNQE